MLGNAFSPRRNLGQLWHRPDTHEAVVDGIRALAVLIVVASHIIFTTQFYVPAASAQFNALSPWWRWPVQGFLGVDMFFVISGFLIGGILLAEYKRMGRIRIGNFFLRRAFRLMPLYWVALALSAFVILANGRTDMLMMNVVVHTNVDEIWKNLLYINNFFRPSEQFGAMSHSWSLAVEEQFYLLFPLGLIVFFRTGLRRHPGKVVLVLTLAYLAIRVACRIYSLHLWGSECGYSPEELKHLKVDPLLMLSSTKMQCLFDVETDVMFDNLYSKYIALLVGVVCAYLNVFQRQALACFFADGVRSNVLSAIGMMVVVFNFSFIFFVDERSLFNMMYQSFFQQLVFSMTIGALILSGVHGQGVLARGISRFLGARPFYVLAQFSYSMYLFNLLLINLAFGIAAHQVGTESFTRLIGAALPILVPATLLVSLVAYLFVERPFMNLRSKSTAPLTSMPTSSVTTVAGVAP